MLDNMANTIESRNQMFRIPLSQQTAEHISSEEVSIIEGVVCDIILLISSNRAMNRSKKIFISKGPLEQASDYVINCIQVLFEYINITFIPRKWYT